MRSSCVLLCRNAWKASADSRLLPTRTHLTLVGRTSRSSIHSDATSVSQRSITRNTVEGTRLAPRHTDTSTYTRPYSTKTRPTRCDSTRRCLEVRNFSTGSKQEDQAGTKATTQHTKEQDGQVRTDSKAGVTTSTTLQETSPDESASTTAISSTPDSSSSTELSEEFGRSEKASQAAQVNLSARLSKDSKSTPQRAGFGEIWRLIKIAKPEASRMGWAVGLLLISSSITMAIPFSIGRILDAATNAESADMIFGLDPGKFYIALGSVLILGASANYGRIIILRIVGERLINRLRAQLFRRTIIQDAEFFDANRIGDLISRLSSDTVIVGKSVTQNLSDGLRSLISGGAGAALMAYTSVKLTGVLSLAFPPIGIAAFFYGRAIRNLSRRIQRSLGSLTKIAEERLGNVRTTQAFAAEVSEVNRYDKQVRKIFNLGKREAFISATFFSASGLMGNMTILLLLYFGGGMVKSGAISIGELTSFLMYTAYAGSSLFGLSSFYSELMKGVGAASRLFELQDRYPTLSPTKGTPVKSARGPIKFDHVTFSYPTRPAVQIFKDLTFEVDQGTNVAIVGPSGGGKSTIASLLLRFYSPTSGSIQVNGVDITTMNAKQLRRKIGYVGQEPVLFSGTIAENIAYGVPNATRAEITAAARKANCTFISDFPEGLDTNAGPRGAQLSGGQKQRIAIARALIKNPDILILDEATSALDAESETLVNSALAALLRGNNTTISIAHRLSTIKRSDQIIVLSSDGKVAEQGSYQELSTRSEGAFTKLMEWQMSGGEVEGAPATPTVGINTPQRGGRPTELEELEAARQHDEHEDEHEEEHEDHDDEEVMRGKDEKVVPSTETVEKEIKR